MRRVDRKLVTFADLSHRSCLDGAKVDIFQKKPGILYRPDCDFKVNSVQESCAKFFAVHILRFEILQATLKNKTNKLEDFQTL